jgi:predicted glutamine amidotransferase
MCRWLAYAGAPVFLDSLVSAPEHSLIAQSLRARQSVATTNGDGFGIGWYGDRPEPGLFRDTLPAWNDGNLLSLCEQIRSRLFFAHVRASTGTATSRVNCHPFRYGSWLFMHNGMIGGFERVRRELTFSISPRLFPTLQGSTDSEVFFLLLLSNGLAEDPFGAFSHTVAQVLGAMKAQAIELPFRMTAAATDGRAIHVIRFSSDGNSPSLYYRKERASSNGDTVLILSEPLDEVAENWIAVPESYAFSADGKHVHVRPFRPAERTPT